MLTILGPRRGRYCDGISRRGFLRAGSLGGLSLAGLLQAQANAANVHSDAAVVMIYLPGGPTQHETFDPKPLAPQEIRGSFGTINTRVPGVEFCQQLPKLASIADRFSIVRTLVGMHDRHESYQCYTGRPGGRSDDAEPGGGWPSLGSVVSRLIGPVSPGAAPYVDAAPKMAYGPYNNTGLHDGTGKISGPGFTGPQHAPLTIEGDVKSDLVLNGIDSAKLADRRALLASVDRSLTRVRREFNGFQQQAFELLTSNRMAEALDLNREDPRTRERYGAEQETNPEYGGAPQSPARLLLARRLIEAGVRCVTVSFGAWDWHGTNREGTIEHHAKKYLPLFDHALTAFLTDLDERGLLARTSVVVWGEFGRTPRINNIGGRDHWPSTQSILLAGGGIRGGRVVGRTDPHGGQPVDRPVHVQEVFATLYRNLGLDTGQVTLTDFNGRPRYLVDDNRQPIAELL